MRRMSGLIRKDAAIEAVKKDIANETDTSNTLAYVSFKLSDMLLNRAANRIRKLPTIEERKKGKWIVEGEFIDCSVCRREKWSRMPYEDLVKRFRYCPNCGADMRGEQE